MGIMFVHFDSRVERIQSVFKVIFPFPVFLKYSCIKNRQAKQLIEILSPNVLYIEFLSYTGNQSTKKHKINLCLLNTLLKMVRGLWARSPHWLLCYEEENGVREHYLLDHFTDVTILIIN
jgi:hypothetical protein